MHPLQQNCNPLAKDQMAAWCWAAGLKDSSPARPDRIPLIIPQLTAGISEMLHDFGFRWHEELQVKWIEGGAGLGTMARIVDHQPRDFVQEGGEAFLKENNPKLYEFIKTATPEDKKKLMTELQKNFEQIEKVMNLIKPEEE